MVRVAFAVVEYEPEDVRLTCTVSPLLMAPDADVKAPLLIEYFPPVIEIPLGH